MTPTDITMDIGARSLGDAIDRTQWSLREQLPCLGQVATSHGMLALTKREKAELRAFLERLLNHRLQILSSLEGPL
ncbi:hypothetical protein [Halomonas sp. E14]|uniref:hypothetical protein n=1 Tax=Halomonas sp. E14 TaxID=3397245 RepID=UPI00403E8DB3